MNYCIENNEADLVSREKRYYRIRNGLDNEYNLTYKKNIQLLKEEH